MKNIIKFFVVGFLILIVAILLNLFANLYNLNTWYDLLGGNYNLNLINIGWLFLVYPFTLGFVARIASIKLK